jgi:GlpG protein
VAFAVAAEERSDRPWRRTPGADDRRQPAGLTFAQPVADFADDLFVYCVHRSCIFCVKRRNLDSFYYHFSHSFMRVIETSLEEDLSLFSRYLWQNQVRHRIYEERGQQVLEVAESGTATYVRSTYDAWRAGKLTLERQSSGGSITTDRAAVVVRVLRRYPGLIAVLALSLAVFPFSVQVADGRLVPLAGYLTIVDLESAGGAQPGLAALLETGQIWRWITPIFLHFSVVHLLFNIAVTTDFGRRIEFARGSFGFIGLVVIIGLLSNVGQYLLGGNPLFGGLSGVAYGLLGFVLVSQRRFPEEAAWQVHPGFAFSLVIFLVIFSTGITEPFGLYVANEAHWIGLISGGLLALVHRKRRTHD